MIKILTIKKLIKELKPLRKNGKKLGFCYGVFDILHPGHAKHLEVAKKMCDILIVGLTSDKQVKKRKSPERPIVDEKLRAYLISQLQSVDYVFIRDENTAINSIKKIKPHLCIKGEDYLGSKDKYLLLESEAARLVGGKIVFTKTGEFSKIRTSKIIDKIKKIP
ncbi:MAG: adenylyltransferase/cytidyltransferase family protein [bacterium]|nr:adenylyltransferase/cytidyltransferase family protein [bacterium]